MTFYAILTFWFVLYIIPYINLTTGFYTPNPAHTVWMTLPSVQCSFPKLETWGQEVQHSHFWLSLNVPSPVPPLVHCNSPVYVAYTSLPSTHLSPQTARISYWYSHTGPYKKWVTNLALPELWASYNSSKHHSSSGYSIFDLGNQIFRGNFRDICS